MRPGNQIATPLSIYIRVGNGVDSLKGEHTIRLVSAKNDIKSEKNFAFDQRIIRTRLSNIN